MGPGSRPPPATLPPVRLWAVPSGLRLPAVWEGGLFVQSSLTVSKSLPGALVPNENVAGLSPATPHPPWSAGPSLPSPNSVLPTGSTSTSPSSICSSRLSSSSSSPPPRSHSACWILPLGVGRRGQCPEALKPRRAARGQSRRESCQSDVSSHHP